MKTSLIISIFLLLTASSRADIVIQSYEDKKPFGFQYGSWSGETKPDSDGIAISGTATRRGGAGNNLSPSLDLRGNTQLAIRVKLLPGNQADTFNVLLRTRVGPGDHDFQSTQYTFQTQLLKESDYVTLRFPLDPGSGIAGEHGHVNLAMVDQVQIQGNFSNAHDSFRMKIKDIRVTR